MLEFRHGLTGAEKLVDLKSLLFKQMLGGINPVLLENPDFRIVFAKHWPSWDDCSVLCHFSPSRDGLYVHGDSRLCSGRSDLIAAVESLLKDFVANHAKERDRHADLIGMAEEFLDALPTQEEPVP